MKFEHEPYSEKEKEVMLKILENKFKYTKNLGLLFFLVFVIITGYISYGVIDYKVGWRMTYDNPIFTLVSSIYLVSVFFAFIFYTEKYDRSHRKLYLYLNHISLLEKEDLDKLDSDTKELPEIREKIRCWIDSGIQLTRREKLAIDNFIEVYGFMKNQAENTNMKEYAASIFNK